MLTRIFRITCALLITLILAGCTGQLEAEIRDQRATEPESMSQAKNDNIQQEVSYVTDAPVYHTVEQLAGDSHLIFRGKLIRTETVDLAEWFWEIYEVTEWYKGAEQKEVRLVSQPNEVAKKSLGQEYLIFAEEYESPIFPYPIVNPIYNQAIFPIGPDGTVQVPDTVDKSMLPLVTTDQFAEQLLSKLTNVPAESPEVYRVADNLPDTKAMIEASDLVMKVTFDQVEQFHQYLWKGNISQSTALYRSAADVELPSVVDSGFEIKAGVEYLVFLRYDSLRDGLILAARQGAIVPVSEQNIVNEVEAVIKSLPAK